MQLQQDYKIALNGINGNTYIVYASSSTYIQVYVGGVLRMEM